MAVLMAIDFRIFYLYTSAQRKIWVNFTRSLPNGKSHMIGAKLTRYSNHIASTGAKSQYRRSPAQQTTKSLRWYLPRAITSIANTVLLINLSETIVLVISLNKKNTSKVLNWLCYTMMRNLTKPNLMMMQWNALQSFSSSSLTFQNHPYTIYTCKKRVLKTIPIT